MKMEVLDRDGWGCRCCGIDTRRHPDGRVRPDTLSFDHVIPEARGGLTHPSNLQPLCMRCNMHKGVATVDLRQAADEWYQLYHEGLAQLNEKVREGRLSPVSPDRHARFGFNYAAHRAPVLWVGRFHPERDPFVTREYRWPRFRLEARRLDTDWPGRSGINTSDVHRMPYCYDKELRAKNAPLLRIQLEPDGLSYVREQRASLPREGLSGLR